VSNANEVQSLATELAIMEWELSYGFTPECKREIIQWEVYSSIEDVKVYCGNDIVDACHLRNYDDESTIIMYEGTYNYETAVYAHELTHWLQHCSGRGSDTGHKEKGVWGDGFEKRLRNTIRENI